MWRTSNAQVGDERTASLEVYLLPPTPWDEVLALQHRLVYEISGYPRDRAALILCEHPTIITVGRQGSRRHILADDSDLRAQRIEVRWTNRGGGCWLQTPGQLAVYPILPVEPPVMGLARYRDALYETMLAVLREFDIEAQRDAAASGIHVDGREIGSVGIAVKSWVAYHGCQLNVNVPLHRFDCVQPNPSVSRRMSSMFRERRLPIRTDAVRASFLRQFVNIFGFRHHFLCNPPPLSLAKRPVNAAS